MKRITYLTLLIEVLGISIIIPAFPELKVYYGVGNFEITLGLTLYSLFAFLFAPMLGQRSDKVGRKKSLARCIAGTALSYFVMLIQPRYRVFLIARIVNGITGGNISIIQAIITDVSPDQESKNKNFGLLGAFFGLGFIIGPVLGSILLQLGGVEAIFLGGGIIATLQFFLFLIFFHNTNDRVTHKAIQYNPIKTIIKYLKRQELQPRLLSFISLGFGLFIINATQSLYMADKFGTSGITYGYYLAGVGVIAAINMALLVPKFRTKYLSTQTILVINFASMLIGYVLLSIMPTEVSYMVLFFLTVLFTGAYGVLYNVHIMSYAQPDEIGELSGMFGSIQNLAMIIGPFIGGIMLETHLDIHRGAIVFFLIAIAIMRKTLTKSVLK